jgi:hypothetical protein
MAVASTDFWLAMSPEDRIGCVFEMWDEQTQLQDLQDVQHEASQATSESYWRSSPAKGLSTS